MKEMFYTKSDDSFRSYSTVYCYYKQFSDDKEMDKPFISCIVDNCDKDIDYARNIYLPSLIHKLRENGSNLYSEEGINTNEILLILGFTLEKNYLYRDIKEYVLNVDNKIFVIRFQNGKFEHLSVNDKVNDIDFNSKSTIMDVLVYINNNSNIFFSVQQLKYFSDGRVKYALPEIV